jgi:hypothetical protein
MDAIGQIIGLIIIFAILGLAIFGIVALGKMARRG